ncbi:MAG: DUF4266 domain-containing protein [Ferruginibacter sp.]
MLKLLIKTSCAGAFLIIVVSSCKTVKPYQKQYLNDNCMQLGAFPSEKSENEAVSYREGASGGDMGKSGGGCGCN